MVKWEYKTRKFTSTGFLGGLLDVDKFNYELNELGKNGWELVNCFSTNKDFGSSRSVIAVFKRNLE